MRKLMSDHEVGFLTREHVEDFVSSKVGRAFDSVKNRKRQRRKRQSS